jgi:hypothetical protein
VWPPDARTNRRNPQSLGAAASRALLCAVCLLGSALALRGQSAVGAGGEHAPREKDAQRAEKVLAKLRLLDAAAEAREDGGDFHRLARKLYPGLFVTVADMRPGDLKTDLDTAVFLYEDVGRAWSSSGASTADCERERPDLYRPLCLRLGGGTARQLLLAKARLHARWAEAVVRAYRGEGGGETSRLLSDMRAARSHDILIAARVTETLKTLELMVNAPSTYADYQEQRAAAKVSFETLEAGFGDALDRAEVLLGWMPRSPAYYHIARAERSYRDGLFWYRKTRASRTMVVSAATAFERDPLQDLRLDAERVGYTAVVNWKAAAKYTRLARQSLSAAAP